VDGTLASPDKIIEILNEVFEGISGLSGIHCCGNTDWPVLLKSNLDILNFDAYNYADSLSLYPREVKAFIDRGGAIAWGIIPTNIESLESETVASLKDRFEEALAPFTRHDIPYRKLLSRSLITPACGLTYSGISGAERALELLAGLAQEVRKRI